MNCKADSNGCSNFQRRRFSHELFGLWEMEAVVQHRSRSVVVHLMASVFATIRNSASAALTARKAAHEIAVRKMQVPCARLQSIYRDSSCCVLGKSCSLCQDDHTAPPRQAGSRTILTRPSAGTPGDFALGTNFLATSSIRAQSAGGAGKRLRKRCHLCLHIASTTARIG